MGLAIIADVLADENNNWDVCFHKFVDNSQEKKKLEDLLKELVRMTAQSEQSY